MLLLKFLAKRGYIFNNERPLGLDIKFIRWYLGTRLRDFLFEFTDDFLIIFLEKSLTISDIINVILNICNSTSSSLRAVTIDDNASENSGKSKSELEQALIAIAVETGQVGAGEREGFVKIVFGLIIFWGLILASSTEVTNKIQTLLELLVFLDGSSVSFLKLFDFFQEMRVLLVHFLIFFCKMLLDIFKLTEVSLLSVSWILGWDSVPNHLDHLLLGFIIELAVFDDFIDIFHGGLYSWNGWFFLFILCTLFCFLPFEYSLSFGRDLVIVFDFNLNGLFFRELFLLCTDYLI